MPPKISLPEGRSYHKFDFEELTKPLTKEEMEELKHEKIFSDITPTEIIQEIESGHSGSLNYPGGLKQYKEDYSL